MLTSNIEDMDIGGLGVRNGARGVDALRGTTTVSPDFDDGEAEDFGEHRVAAAQGGNESFVAAGGKDEDEEEVGKDGWEDIDDEAAAGAGGMSSLFWT